MNDEIAHLRRYAETGDHDAFAEVVGRCLPLVYGAARRRVGGDAHRARDVTQLVFVALARNAARVARREELCGWLYTTTQFLAAKMTRTEGRRVVREREAQLITMTTTTEGEPGDGSGRLHGLLDEVIAELKQLDREVVLWRFYRGLRWAEIAARLGVTENAAQKRLDRAIEVLREKLARRGVHSTAAAVGVALEAQGAVVVPAGLTASVTTAAVTCGEGASGALVWAGNFMAMTKLQMGIAAAVAIAGLAGLGWQYRENARLRVEMARREMEVRSEVARVWAKRMELQVKRAEAAEADVGELLRAVGAAANRAKSEAETAPLAKWRYDWSLARADALTQKARWQEALDELVRCYRELRAIQQYSPQSRTVMARMKALMTNFPAAEGALRDLRDGALRELRDKPDEAALLEVVALNTRLGEDALTLALYDALPKQLWGHPEVRVVVTDQLVRAQRYREASEMRSFEWMNRDIDSRIKQASSAGFSPSVDKRAWVVTEVLADIEILTAIGRREDAGVLTGKVLAFDASEATRAALRARVERAGGS